MTTVEAHLRACFPSECFAKGEALAMNGAVSIARSGDRAVDAYVGASSRCKVSLESDGVDAPSLRVRCSCSRAARGRLCVHGWAAIAYGLAQGLDFFSGKTHAEARAPSAASQERKATQTEMRKTQNRQKRDRARDLKKSARLESRGKTHAKTGLKAALSDEVEAAVAYFALNGFPLSHPLALEELNEAKKKLSRVFHPDRGGAHAEMVELNLHYETLAHEP